MVRYAFGGEITHTVATVGTGNALLLAPSAAVTFYASEGGSAVTDFLLWDASTSAYDITSTSVTTTAGGTLPRFQGPDGISELWAQDASGSWLRLRAYDAALHGVPSGGTSGQALVKGSTTDYDVTWGTVSGSTSDATTAAKGVVQLAGDLGGTAAAPTVPGLADKAPLVDAALTGAPTAPTPTAANGIATRAFVLGQALAGVTLDRTSDAAGSLDTVLAAGVVDDWLIVPLPATGKTIVDFFLPFTGDPTDDLKMDLRTSATGATVYGWATGHGTGATGPTGTALNNYTVTAFGQVMIFGAFGPSTPSHVRGQVTVKTTGTSGNLTFRYCRNSNTSGAAGAGTPVLYTAGANVRSVQLP